MVVRFICCRLMLAGIALGAGLAPISSVSTAIQNFTVRFIDGRRKRDHARPSLDAVGIATTPVCAGNLSAEIPFLRQTPCSSDGERIICPPEYALSYGGMKRHANGWSERKRAGLVRGHTPYEAIASPQYGSHLSDYNAMAQSQSSVATASAATNQNDHH